MENKIKSEEIADKIPAAIEQTEESQGEEVKKKVYTEEELLRMKESITHQYIKNIFFQMYKSQVMKVCEYAVANRKSIKDIKDEIRAKVSPLSSSTRKFIMEFKEESFVELASMIGVDFTHDYKDQPVTVVVGDNKKNEEDGKDN